MANHALLMKRHIPTVPQPVSKNPIWRYGNRPMLFTGTVYTDGSTTINHAFPEARRSGYAAVVIGEQLRDSDSDLAIQNNTYHPEIQNEANKLGMIESTTDDEKPNTIIIHHTARQ